MVAQTCVTGPSGSLLTLLARDRFSFAFLQCALSLDNLASHLLFKLVLVLVDPVCEILFSFLDFPAQFLNVLRRLSILHDLIAQLKSVDLLWLLLAQVREYGDARRLLADRTCRLAIQTGHSLLARAARPLPLPALRRAATLGRLLTALLRIRPVSLILAVAIGHCLVLVRVKFFIPPWQHAPEQVILRQLGAALQEDYVEGSL